MGNRGKSDVNNEDHSQGWGKANDTRSSHIVGGTSGVGNLPYPSRNPQASCANL